MKVLLCTSLLLALAAFASAGVTGRNFSDPEHPGKCAIKATFIVSPGVYQNRDECGRIVCSTDGFAEFYSCENRQTQIPGCSLGQYVDRSNGYPTCCQQYLDCPGNPTMHGQLV